MKLIHCADIHLGSKLDSRLKGEKSLERKNEIRATFSRLIEFARQNSIGVIMLAGDIFDSDRPLKKDKEFFYSAVKNNPDIDFLYLRGNHDSLESYSVYDLKNLKTFGGEITSYRYQNVVISSIELNAENSLSFYSLLNLQPDDINIFMLHGQLADSEGEGQIALKKLRDKNIDYLALGHIHSHSVGKIDDRGIYCYSGALEGRGFDECGQKGFVVLDTDDKLSYEFVPFAKRTIHKLSLDASDCSDAYGVYQKVRDSICLPPTDLIYLELVGETDFDSLSLKDDILEYLNSVYFFSSVKDKTVRKFSPSDYEGKMSLKSEFIKTVLSNDSLSQSDKQQIISLGIKALELREVE